MNYITNNFVHKCHYNFSLHFQKRIMEKRPNSCLFSYFNKKNSGPGVVYRDLYGPQSPGLTERFLDNTAGHKKKKDLKVGGEKGKEKSVTHGRENRKKGKLGKNHSIISIPPKSGPRKEVTILLVLDLSQKSFLCFVVVVQFSWGGGVHERPVKEGPQVDMATPAARRIRGGDAFQVRFLIRGLSSGCVCPCPPS